MEGFIGLLLTFGIVAVVMYIIVIISLIVVPIIVIAIVVYLIKEAKKGNQAGVNTIRQTEKLTKNEIVGDEDGEVIKGEVIKSEVINTEEDEFLDFDAGIKNKF